MSNPIYLGLFSDGKLWFTNDADFFPGVRNESSDPTGVEAGTIVKWWKINSDATGQLITTLTGSGNSSASALAATGGSTTKSAAPELQ